MIDDEVLDKEEKSSIERFVNTEVFEDFIRDPSLTFEMMLYLGGVDCLDYS